MRAIGAIIRWGPAADRAEEPGALEALLPRASAPAAIHRVDGATLAAVHLWGGPLDAVVAEDLAVVADVRIDDAASLKRELGGEDPLGDSPVALLARAYRRWGDGFAAHVAGDFSVVVWDRSRRRAVLACDPFAARPLYYRVCAERLVVASAVEHVLDASGVRPDVDPESVVDYLRDHMVRGGRTMFRGVARVRGGHVVEVQGTTVNERRTWHAPTTEVRMRSDEYPRAFRDLLDRAVRDRLAGGEPVVTHLSGGLDSSSITLLADRARGPADPPLTAVSQVFPGLQCDESSYIDAVERRLHIPVLRWDGRTPSLLDLEAPSRAAPGGRTHWVGGSRGDLDIVRRVGARVVLSGDGGDTLTDSRAVMRDLRLRRLYLAIIREYAHEESTTSRRRALRRATLRLFRSFVRGPVRTLLRRGSHPAAPPAWLTPDLGSRWTLPRAPLPPRPRGSSFLQDFLFDALTGDNTQAMLEWQRRVGQELSVEHRFPMLDARLARFVLSIPAEDRIPHGRPRRLHEEAVRDLLPPEVRARDGKASFASAVQNHVEVAAPAIARILDDASWCAAPFVDRAAARRLFADLSARPPTMRAWRDCAHLWRIVTLEAWLRARR